MVNIDNTEIKIVEAATRVFVKKGFDGARMQEIADEAGINKALINYYFRTKQKLFESVFTSVFEDIASNVSRVLEASKNLEEMLENFVDVYFTHLSEKPYIPDFVIHELNRNPDLIVKLIKTKGIDREKLVSIIVKEGDRKDLRPFDPVQIIINVLSMSIFPFVASPLIKGFIFEGDEEMFHEFLSKRKIHIIEFVKSAIFK